MYKQQPETYYKEIASLACLVLQIPASESDNVLGVKTIREKEKKNIKYNIKGFVKYKTIYVNKYEDKLAKAKMFFYHFLWENNIKSPDRNKSEYNYILKVKEQLLKCEEFKFHYDLFNDLALDVKIVEFRKRTVIEYS